MEQGFDHPKFQNDSRWPRRLLHVPSMTSYAWQPGNTYGGRREPEYVAISYTWGRFMLKDGELPHVKPLKIKGVDWPIPRINPDTHFSVDEFQRAIWETVKEPDRHYTFNDWKWETMRNQSWRHKAWMGVLAWLEKTARVYDFLWLDIACIDQRWNTTTMREIGRQARIFRHAKHTYAWLSRHPYTTLEPIVRNIEHALFGLQHEPFPSQQNGQQDLARFDSRPLVELALDSLTQLVTDPWFSSLWTLQEAFLCNHAFILSRDSRCVCEGHLLQPQSCSLDYLFSYANDIIMWSERSHVPKAEPQYSQLMKVIHDSGLAALWYNSPMALLGVSYNRQSTRELDRVYGVMQVFGSDFKVGLSREEVDPGYEHTLSELEDEFGTAILNKYPVLSQMHVYLDQPAIGKGWCVRGNSAVPAIAERGDLFGWDSGNRIDVNRDAWCVCFCELSTQVVQGVTWAHLSGRACSFKVLQRAWLEADEAPYTKKIMQSGWRMHRCTIPSIQMIALDRGIDFSSNIPGLDIVNVVNEGDQMRQHQLAALLAAHYEGVGLKVFLLGRCHYSDHFHFDVGLLLLKRNAIGIPHWRRIGICMWLTSHLPRPEEVRQSHVHQLLGESPEWDHLEGFYG